jgi:hypothetical protein
MEAFFDRVNHDRLVVRLKQHTNDPTLLRLINRYLKAGVNVGGSVQATTQGVPQGGPLSPVLANVVLDELDWELERRGHRFARYADDCNIMVKSQRAGERVMASVSRFVSDSLRLTVNPLKSAVDRPAKRKFLGFTVSRNGARLKVADKAIDKLKDRIRELTRRTRGHRLADIVAELRITLLGWKAYRHCRSAESSARHRQMAAAKVTLLYLEAMGKSRLPGTVQTRRVCARSMEHQQVCTWPVALVENLGAIAGLASEGLQQFGSAIPCGVTGICPLNRRVRSRMHGGVGGVRSRGLPLSRLGVILNGF